jgi:MinD superfamily P-loop ATPase
MDTPQLKELVVLSGKGGTGKTTLTAGFAALAGNKMMCDADVDASDLHLLMSPEIMSTSEFKGGGTAVINPDRCTQCGLCRDVCRFDAVDEKFTVDPIGCEGCGVCVDLCPEQAVDFPVNTCGEWYISTTRFGPMVHAALGIAEENSGKLVTLVRNEARKIAGEKQLSLIITDGPPGIGCPVIASVGGADAVLVVTEPTLSGVHDMKRVAELATYFKVPVMVCVNKFDLNIEQSEIIEQLAKNNGMSFVGKLAFDPVYTEAMINGKTVIEYDGSSAASLAVQEVWNNIITRLNIE